jgi:WD40 repeat protein
MSVDRAAEPSGRTYYLTLKYRIIGLVVIALGVLPGLSVLPAIQNRDKPLDLGFYVFALVAVLLLFDLMLAFGLAYVRVRLVVTARGITYHAIGYTVRSSWANIAGPGESSTPTGQIAGLLLNRSGLEASGWLSASNKILPFLVVVGWLGGRILLPRSSLPDDRFIPLSFFASDLDRSDLMNDIRRYAPQIPEPTKSAASTPAADAAASDQDFPSSDRSHSLRRLGVLAGIIVIEIAFVVSSVQAWQGGVAPVRTLNVDGWVAGLSFSSDSQTLTVATSSGTVQQWRVSDGTLLQTHNLTGSIESFALTADGQTMAAGLGSGAVAVWQTSDGTLLRTLGQVERVACPPCASHPPVTFAPDGRALASGSKDGTIHVWRVGDGQELFKLKASQDSNDETITSVAFAPNGQVLAASAESLKNTVQVWRLDTGGLMGVFPGLPFPGQSFANNLTFAPDGQMLAVSTLDQGVWLIRSEDRGPAGTLSVPDASGRFDEWMAVFSPDNHFIASVTNGGALQIWRVSDRTLLRTLRAHTQQIRQVAFSPDGRYIATGSFDATVRLWQVSDVTK